VQQPLDSGAGLRRHLEYVGHVAADDVRKLGGVPLGLGGGQVDLVQHGDHVEVGAERQVQVRQGLRLDALCGIDEQHRCLAASTEQAKQILDRLAAHADPATVERMHEAFATASRYEWMFWDAAWRQETWPV